MGICYSSVCFPVLDVGSNFSETNRVLLKGFTLYQMAGRDADGWPLRSKYFSWESP